MNGEIHELELNLDSSPAEKTEVWDLLVPIHLDKFALALASGFVGGSIKPDSPSDFQNRYGDGLVGFHHKAPSLTVSDSNPCDHVLLFRKIMRTQESQVCCPEVLSSPTRITDFDGVYFKDEASLANFKATFKSFPDVPTQILPTSTKWPVLEVDTENFEDPCFTSIDLKGRRATLDFLGGFATGILKLMNSEDFDGSLLDFLSNLVADEIVQAQNLLLAFDDKSSETDLSIWSATLRVLRQRFGKAGFDRQSFVEEVGSLIDSNDTEAVAWVDGCLQLINAEIDAPILSDNENIGRRAALAILLSQDPSRLNELKRSFGCGPRVLALATIASYAFHGLSRLGEEKKSPACKMAAILEISETMFSGGSVPLEIQTTRIANDLVRHQTVSVSGNVAFDRDIEPPPYMVMLKARIQEAGYDVEVDPVSGQIRLLTEGPKVPVIKVEDCPRSTTQNPVVNLVLPLTLLGARPTNASLKDLLTVSWKYATTVGLRNNNGADEVVAVASLPLATLDRDELNFHVDRLLRVFAEVGNPKKLKL